MPNLVRQLSIPPLAGLEGQGSGSVGGGGPSGGVSHPLPPASSSVYGTHPHAFVCPYFNQRGCSRGGHRGVDCQGCCGACSSSLSRLLQLPACGLEDLGVVASGHRPVPAQLLCGHFTLSHGDHPVCSHFSSTGGLDGLHRSSGGVSSSSCASGISSLPVLCGSWPHLPIQRVVLRSVHGPAGLHSCYGSCIRCSSFLGYPYVLLPGRLARPGVVPGGSPPGSRGCLVPLSRVGDCSQPGEVQLRSVSGGTVSRVGHRRKDFYGFCMTISRLQAAVNLRRISVLRSSSCQLMAVASGDAVLSVSSGSSWPPADAVAPALPSPLLGSVGSFRSGAVVSGLSSGPSVVASWGSPLSQLTVCLSFRCPRIWTFGPTLPTSAGGLTWGTGLFPAFGTSWRLFFPSMPGSCWLCVMVSFTSSPFRPGPRWPCFATMSLRSPICGRRGAHGLLLSTPLRRRSSLGRNPGVRFSAVVHPSPGVRKASGVSPDPPHPHRPVLASASLVRGPPPVVGGSISDFQCTPSSSSSISLVDVTRFSTGWPFMPGDLRILPLFYFCLVVLLVDCCVLNLYPSFYPCTSFIFLIKTCKNPKTVFYLHQHKRIHS